MNARQMTFPMPEGGQATLDLSEPVTAEVLEMVEEISTLMFRSLRRNAPERQVLDAGAREYDSWLVRDAGAVEYDSWVAREAGAIEYDSWRFNA